MRTPTVSRCSPVIPGPTFSEATFARFTHADLADLSPEARGAELAVLTRWLQARAFHRARPRLIWAAGELITDAAWAEERLRRLRGAGDSASTVRRRVAA